MSSIDFIIGRWPFGKDGGQPEFYALEQGEDANGDPCLQVRLFIQDFTCDDDPETIDGVEGMDYTGLTMWPKEGFSDYEDMLDACIDYVHSFNFIASDAELKRENGELWKKEIWFNHRGGFTAEPWEKVQLDPPEE